MTEKIGPVQLVATGFPPDAEFEGRIMDQLERLESHETIRILDLLFVAKDAETGDLIALDYQGEDLGAIVGALLGFEFEDGGELEGGPTEGIGGHAFGLSQSEIHDMAASLRPGSSAGFVLIEPVWARELRKNEQTNKLREGKNRGDLWQREPQTGGRRGRPTGRRRACSGVARSSRAGLGRTKTLVAARNRAKLRPLLPPRLRTNPSTWASSNSSPSSGIRASSPTRTSRQRRSRSWESER